MMFGGFTVQFMDSLPINVLISYHCQEYWNVQKIALSSYKNYQNRFLLETSRLGHQFEEKNNTICKIRFLGTYVQTFI